MRSEGFSAARMLALVVPLGLILGALGSQFIGHLVPCEMCMWQRWPHYAAIGVALLAFVAPARGLQLLLICVAALLIGTSGVIGVLHAGVEYRWWPGFTPCAGQLDAHLSGLDMLREIAKRPVISCDTPQWTLFGISLAGFNALFSLAGALAIFGLLLQRRHA
jgi:disulfide bond formation protein DsbB